MKKHIPNLITSLNVISGTLALFLAMYGLLLWAVLFVILAMVFDFFDGMTARLLHVKSGMGKELDSLADVVSFGVAPAVFAHLLMLSALPGGSLDAWPAWTLMQKIVLFVPLLIPAFSAYRLAKFNLDVRQVSSFIGLPTPANALFWLSLVYGFYKTPEMYAGLFGNVWTLALCALVLSVLLISELPMFSLKVAGFRWKENKIRYLYFACLLILWLVWGRTTVLFVIPLYILFAVVSALGKIFTSSDR